MILSNLLRKRLVLASKSPRRKQLLEGLGLSFEIRLKEVEEEFPSDLKAGEIPLFLASLKAAAFRSEMKDDEVIITADTVVWLGDKVLNKPQDRTEALSMLERLSGRAHTVYTAVNIMSNSRSICLLDETEVRFKKLDKNEIEYYVDEFKPFDKAGAYGVQEFIGYIGIDSLNGSFYNVMGLPIHRVYEELKQF